MIKKLTTPSGVFGPYTAIEVLSDRYRCDGADLPFSVIGEGSIQDWIDDLPEIEIVINSIQDSISPAQLREALLLVGLLDTVEMAVNSGDRSLQIWWEFATSFSRSNPKVRAMVAALGKSDEDMDNIWTLAVTL
jgi:hypothetical protein